MSCAIQLSRLMGLAGCVLVAAGCGGNSDLPEMAPASGVVTFEGKPLPNATVMFASKQQGKGYQAGIGTTDASGQFALRSYDTEGVVTGAHEISISCTDPDSWPKDSNGNRVSPMSPLWKPQKSVIPEKYGNPSQSGLTADVLVSGENQFKFDLKAE